MATKVLLKKSSVPNRVPETYDLEYGELALNYADGKLYYKNSNNEVKSIASIDLPVSISEGGTGATTRAQALNNLLPNQSVAANLYLTSDGTNAFWQDIAGGIGSISDSSVFVDTFTGDGSTTIFELSVAPGQEQESFVAINGVLQDTTTYTVAGTSLTFSTAPASGDNIDVRTVTVVSTKLTLRDFQKYIYTVSSNTTTISGADDNGNVLEYDSGKVDVYQNGVRLLEGSDYVAIDGSLITFTTTLESGDSVELLTYSAAYFLENPVIVDTEALTTTTTDQTVDSYVKSKYRTAKYIIQATHSTGVHSAEVLLTHDDNDVYITEYATIYSGTPLVTISADIDSTHVYLKVTPANANTTIDFARTALVARTI